MFVKYLRDMIECSLNMLKQQLNYVVFRKAVIHRGDYTWFYKDCAWEILGSMLSHLRVIVGLSQSAPAVGWGSPLHAWLALVNWIGSACYLNRGYHYGARGMHYHILLRQYNQNYYTYNSVVKNTYSPCHKMYVSKFQLGIPNDCCVTKA